MLCQLVFLSLADVRRKLGRIPLVALTQEILWYVLAQFYHHDTEMLVACSCEVHEKKKSVTFCPIVPEHWDLEWSLC